MVQHPEVLWAQRSSASTPEKNVVYLTVNLPNIKESTVEFNLTDNNLHFKATAGDNEKSIPEKEYGFDIDFYKDIVPEESSKKVTTRSFYLVLRKKEAQEEYWPRLTKEKVRNAFIKTDFSKWVDEDEQEGVVDDAPDDDMMSAMGGGMPGMGGMGGMPGMGGMGGMPGMGGMGGMPGGMDLEALMAQMGQGGAGGPPGGPSFSDDAEDDSDDDGPPPLEDAEPSK